MNYFYDQTSSRTQGQERDFRDRREISDAYRRRRVEDREASISKARNNSVSSRKKAIIEVNYRGDRFKVSAHRLKVTVVTSFLITAIAATSLGIGLTNQFHAAQDSREVRDALQSYAQLVGNETHRTNDLQGYWYDTLDIAKGVLKDEDIHRALYGVYKDIGYNQANKVEQTDDVIRNMKSLVSSNPEQYVDKPMYNSFNDYLIQNNFVDKEGLPSTKVYEEKMDQYILGQTQMNNIIKETGFKK